MIRRCLALSLLLAACAADDGDVPEGWVPLVTGDWSMPAYQEGYYCARVTADEDMYIRAFRPIAPLGTHHTALAYAGQPGPEGSFPCEASDVGFKILFGSGVGTDAFELPEGVAFKLPANEQLLLNLHLYNVGEAAITGTSGVEVQLLAEADVVHEAEAVYVSNFELEVPPGSSVTTATCTMASDTTVFGVFPHMHQLGTHMKGTAHPAGGSPVVIHDQAYDFEEQLDYLVDPPVALVDGDQITAECSYVNPGLETVTFGDSTDAEMCVLGVYRYPATGGLSLCFD